MIRLRWFNLWPRFPGYAAHLVVRLRPYNMRRVWRAWSRRQPRPNGDATDAVKAASEVQR